MENEKRAQELRAKLLASRQNTPAKATPTSTSAAAVTRPKALDTSSPMPAATPQSATPAPPQPAPLPTQPKTMANGNVKQQQQEKEKKEKKDKGSEKPKEKPRAMQEFDQLKADGKVDELLREGKAKADKLTAELAAKSAPVHNSDRPASPKSSITAEKKAPAPAKAQKPDLFPSHHQQQTQQQQQQQQQHVDPPRPTNLTDSYYADLAAWLELTGYHDVDFRTAKLRTYKERKELEGEAARIAAKLEALRQKELEEMQQLRIGTPKASTPTMPPPRLPQTMPSGKAANGFKRGHSPEFDEKVSRRREDNGFRIRGANESPEIRPGARVSRPPSPNGIERRVSYPDARRRSIDDRAPRSRDPSLERRQSYYRRDDDLPPREYDHYSGPSRGPPPPRGINDRARPARTPQYKGSVGLDLRKGGQYQSRP